MKTKVVVAFAALAYASVVLAGNNAAYPKEKVAAFVVGNLDLTSLPSTIRPKKEKGKKTLADYGYTAQTVQDNDVIIEAPGSVRTLSIKVLDQKPSGIYACVAVSEQKGGEPKAQSVLLLKRYDSTALLKGSFSWREFASCPVIGGNNSQTDVTPY
jgi:uncharacterized protein YpuA (DUF1002 family)